MTQNTMKIRMIFITKWPNIKYNDIADIEQYVLDNRNNINKLSMGGFEIHDFTVPENLDKCLIGDICSGKMYWKTINKNIKYSNWWIFLEKDNNFKSINFSKVCS